MSALKGVMTAQAIVLFVYGLPYLLVPKWATTLTQQLPLPENYLLRAVGIGFVILAYLEFQIVRDLERYRGLDGMERWVGLGVIANNLWVLGRAGPRRI